MDLDQLSVGSHPIHANNEKDSVLIVKWKQREQTANSLNRPRGGTGLMWLENSRGCPLHCLTLGRFETVDRINLSFHTEVSFKRFLPFFYCIMFLLTPFPNSVEVPENYHILQEL